MNGWCDGRYFSHSSGIHVCRLRHSDFANDGGQCNCSVETDAKLFTGFATGLQRGQCAYTATKVNVTCLSMHSQVVAAGSFTSARQPVPTGKSNSMQHKCYRGRNTLAPCHSLMSSSGHLSVTRSITGWCTGSHLQFKCCGSVCGLMLHARIKSVLGLDPTTTHPHTHPPTHTHTHTTYTPTQIHIHSPRPCANMPQRKQQCEAF